MSTQTLCVCDLCIIFLAGIILASVLHKRFSARTIVMTYGILSSVGLVIGSLTTSVPGLALSLPLTGSVLILSLLTFTDRIEGNY